MFAQVMSRHYPLWLVRLLRVALFTILIAVTARLSLSIPGTPVPITMQVFSVLLAGMVLGPLEGSASVVTYLTAIALNMHIDAGRIGTLALVGPTAGFLLGFVPTAAISGLAWRMEGWRRLFASIGFGLAVLVVLYAFGVFGLLPFFKGLWSAAFAAGAIPFIFIDCGKVLLAASLATLGRDSWKRWLLPSINRDL